jgi:tetratricopeptide (TPR) repeat protein
MALAERERTRNQTIRPTGTFLREDFGWVRSVRFFLKQIRAKNAVIACRSQVAPESGRSIEVKNYFTVILLFLVSIAVSAQDMQMKMPAAEKPVAIMTGLGSLHHPVSTSKPEAQRFFDQGLSLIFAFNHDEAVRSFKRAAEIDPRMAMAWWGVALALGPNINQDVDLAHEEAAYEAAQKALALSKDKTAIERAYIEALAKRYSLTPGADLKKLAVNYKDTMGELSKKYPDDLDALRRKHDGPAALEIVGPGGKAGRRHGGDCRRARVRPATQSKSSRRNSLLHPCG